MCALCSSVPHAGKIHKKSQLLILLFIYCCDKVANLFSGTILYTVRVQDLKILTTLSLYPCTLYTINIELLKLWYGRQTDVHELMAN